MNPYLRAAKAAIRSTPFELAAEEIPEAAAKLWANVRRDGECLIWVAWRTEDRLPMMPIRGRLVSARRVALALEEGSAPPTGPIEASCGRAACVAPWHAVRPYTVISG